MIVLDTHVWIWWAEGNPQLPADYLAFVQSEATNGLGVAAISAWEVAKLVALGRIHLSQPVEAWLTRTVQPPVVFLPLTPEVAVESTRLPGAFHRGPADQLIVATARVLDSPLVTLDRQIRAYPHVRLAP